MRRPWPALVLLLGGALLLIALYLPWQSFSIDVSEYGDQGGTVDSLLHMFAGAHVLDAWQTGGMAPATALAALLLIGLSGLAWVRPGVVSRVPIGRSALVAAYFAVAVAVETRSVGMAYIRTDQFAGIDFAYGAYIGLAAAVAMVAGAALLRWGELQMYRSPLAGAAVVLASGLLVAFLLPWERFTDFEYLGISAATANVAAVFAVCMPAARAPRLIAVLAALFTAATFSMTTSPSAREYGAWIGIAFGVGLVVLGLSGGVRRPDINLVPWTRLVLGAAALLLVASFFLPGQKFCDPHAPIGPNSGACVELNGWSRGEASAGVAVLAIALILGELGRLRWAPPRAELAAGIGLLVATFGFQVSNDAGGTLAYGFWVIVACAAVIGVLAALGLRRPRLDFRLAPTVLCLAYLALVVPTWWGVYPYNSPQTFWFAGFSWIWVVGALLALTLIRLWLERSPDARLLFVVPVALAALATLDIVLVEHLTWGTGIVLALCCLLALSAFVEQRGGLGELRIPEILRVDRL